MLVRAACLILLLPIGSNLFRAAIAPETAGELLLSTLWMGATGLFSYMLARRERSRLAASVLVVGLYIMSLYSAYYGGGVRSPGYIGLLGLSFLSVWLVGIGGAIFVVCASVLAGLVLLAIEGLNRLPVPSIEPTPNLFFHSIVLQMVLAILLQWALLRQVARNRAERSESEARFRATFEQAAVGMSHTSLGGAFLRINRRLCEITGYSGDELMAITCRELTHPDDLVADEALERRLLSGEIQTYSLEKRYVRKDGIVIWINLTVSPIRGPSGQIDQLLSVIQDITDRKLAEWALRQLNTTLEERIAERTSAFSLANERLQSEIAVRYQVEQALRESEARYRELLESLQQGVVVFQDDQIVICNTALAEIVGHSREELLSYSPEQLWAIIAGDDRAWLSESVGRALASGHLSSEAPFRFMRPDGEVRWMYSASRIIMFAGRPAMLGMLSDITGLKLAEDELRKSRDELRSANLELARAARLKDEFLANMSHELRTPLNAILGRAELLAELIQGPLNERQLRSVSNIDESGRHLLDLINDILDLSKIEASMLDLQEESVGVADLFEASIRMVAGAAAKKGIGLSSRLDPQVMQIRGDPRRLKQILVNLLSNAIKFTPSGQITLEVQGNPADGIATFSVTDTGIGIAAADLPRLFRPFEQLDSKLSRQYEGTGLGLSLVARLARLHGGSVAVESELGKGSRFAVMLPWRPHEQEGVSARPLSQASP
jgi:PAS domain S-box-containing protein